MAAEQPCPCGETTKQTPEMRQKPFLVASAITPSRSRRALRTGIMSPKMQKQAMTPPSFHGFVFPPQLKARMSDVVSPRNSKPPIQSNAFHRSRVVRLSSGSFSACDGLALTMKKMTTAETRPMGRLIQKQALHVTLLSVWDNVLCESIGHHARFTA